MRVAEADYLGFYTSLTAKSDRKVCNLIGRFSLHYHANTTLLFATLRGQ